MVCVCVTSDVRTMTGENQGDDGECRGFYRNHLLVIVPFRSELTAIKCCGNILSLLNYKSGPCTIR